MEGNKEWIVEENKPYGSTLDNSERIKKVENQEIERKRLYHVSPHKFRVGDIVEPGNKEGTLGNGWVCMSDDPMPHRTISFGMIKPDKWWLEVIVEKRLEKEGKSITGEMMEKEMQKESKRKWYVYEVVPIGPARFYAEEGEIRARGAKVVKFVGDAKSMIEKGLLHMGKVAKEESRKFPGSQPRYLGGLRYGTKIEGKRTSNGYWEVSSRGIRKREEEKLR